MITFEPLWKTMKKKNISQYSLIKDFGFSTGTLDALRKNKSITLNTLNDICNILETLQQLYKKIGMLEPPRA